MPLITRCPSCLTTFEVLPSQLDQAAGQVRCGHCQHVFDARAAQVQPDAGDVATPAPDTPAPAVPLLDTPVALARPQTPMPDDKRQEPTLESGAGAGLSAVGHIRPAQEAAAPTPRLDTARDPAGAPSFVRQAQRRAFWSRGPVRAAGWLLALVLATALAAQWTLHERNRLAAEQPQLAPALQQFCNLLGCRLAPYRHLPALAIGSSNLRQLAGNAFALEVTLHNRTQAAVAMPALALTLTDRANRVVVRRTLHPDDLQAPQTLGGHRQWDAEVGLQLPAKMAATIVNYKIQMLYP